MNGQQSRFSKVNEPFVCEHCGKDVPVASKTCRNHCPYCLFSKHVDIFPGDRANPCEGLLRPIAYEQHSKKGLMLRFRCERCGEETRNIALRDETVAPDSYERILGLTAKA